MERVYNFSAGPAALPEAVLKKAAGELVEYQNAGMSVMEMSHRSPVFQSIMDETKGLVHSVLNIPETHEVLFLQCRDGNMNLLVQRDRLDEPRGAWRNGGAWYAGEGYCQATG